MPQTDYSVLRLFISLQLLQPLLILDWTGGMKVGTFLFRCPCDFCTVCMAARVDLIPIISSIQWANIAFFTNIPTKVTIQTSWFESIYRQWMCFLREVLHIYYCTQSYFNIQFSFPTYCSSSNNEHCLHLLMVTSLICMINVLRVLKHYRHMK